MKFLELFKPKPAHLTIESYGQTSSGASEQQVQSTIQWLLASLMAAGYFGNSHIIWYNIDNPDPSLERLIKKLAKGREPVFLYRCGGRAPSPPNGHCWRMMDEHPSMRIYQLEVRDS